MHLKLPLLTTTDSDLVRRVSPSPSTQEQLQCESANAKVIPASHVGGAAPTSGTVEDTSFSFECEETGERETGHPASTLATSTESSVRASAHSSANAGGAPPVWYIFPGIGSQWPGMGKVLLDIPDCRASLLASAGELSGTGVDLLAVLKSEAAEALRCTVNTIVSITALQIALVDALKSTGVRASGIIGHSIGEIAAGYADGVLSRREAMKIAFIIAGHSKRCKGGMAAVGLSALETSNTCPEGVSVVCCNGAQSVTVAGPSATIAAYISNLKSTTDTLCTLVDSTGVPFHAPTMKSVQRKLRSSLSRILPEERPRSPMWISTSGQQNEACSAMYYTNNVLNSVSFREACLSIPTGAVALELGPSALFRRLLEGEFQCSVALSAMSNRNRVSSDTFEGMVKALQVLGAIAAQDVDQEPTPSVDHARSETPPRVFKRAAV